MCESSSCPCRPVASQPNAVRRAGERQLDSPSYFGFGRLTRLAARTSVWFRRDIDRTQYSDRHRRYTGGAVFLERPAPDYTARAYISEPKREEKR